MGPPYDGIVGLRVWRSTSGASFDIDLRHDAAAEFKLGLKQCAAHGLTGLAPQAMPGV